MVGQRVDGIIASPKPIVAAPKARPIARSLDYDKYQIGPTNHHSNFGSKLLFVIGFLALIGALTAFGWDYYTHSQQAEAIIQPLPTTQPVATAESSPTTTPAAQPAPAPTEPLQTRLAAPLANFANQAGGTGAVVVIDLQTGETAGVNQDHIFTSASIYKLFVAEAIYKKLQAGTIKAKSTVPGTGKSYSQCLKLMITISDNLCGEKLGTVAGWDKQNARLHQLGYANTYLRAYGTQQTSAHDTALLLQRLYRGELVGVTYSAELINNLKNQTINNRFPTGLPAGTVIAHKTGDLSGYIHDAGIVYTAQGQYVIAGLSGPWKNGGSASTAFKQLSQDVYAAMTAR
ncbi:serine hydrolase [Patescibacteria group bacterium]|nr:MAG: serine hydrolase [Patescibacteria group bacterium]